MINLISQEIFTESAYQMHPLGTKGMDKYGSVYRYVKNGSSALVTGNLLQEPAEDTNYRSMVVNTTGAIGSNEVEVTLGGTAVTAGQFDEGQILIESSTGIGQLFRIKKHDVQTSTTGTCTFVLDRPLKIATAAASSQASVRKNAYQGAIQYPTTPTGGAIGVALYAMTISYYGWIGSGGDFAVLWDNTDVSAADAQGIRPSLTVAGCVKACLAADVAAPFLGWSREVVSVASTMCMCHLVID